MKCFICGITFDTVNILVLHFKHIHSSRIEFYQCVENDTCNRVFNSLDSFKKHLKIKHVTEVSNCRNNLASVFKENNILDCVDTNVDIQLQKTGTELECTATPTIDLYEFKNVDVKNTILKIMSKLYSNTLLPRNAAQFFIDYANYLFKDLYSPLLQQKINTYLQSLSDLNVNVADNLKLIFDSVFDTLDEFSTEHRRFKLLENSSYFIKAENILIGQRCTVKHLNESAIFHQEPAILKIVPLRNVLKKIFEIPHFLQTTKDYMNNLYSEDTVISNFIQGDLWKNKKKEHKDKFVVPIFVYFDDYETGNPLGSHSGQNKLGAVYVLLPSTPPYYQAQVKHILLALLFYSADRKQFGNLRIFKPLIDEINYLQNYGIEVTVNNETSTIYFQLGLILGDNLGLHSVLGMCESFSANYCCRFCSIHKKDMYYTTTENTDILRSRNVYDLQTSVNNTSETGIKEVCIWNDVTDFHFTDNFSVDIMHDVLEGICNYTLSVILKKLIYDLQFFSLETLNFRIQSFNFGTLENSNKPPYIMSDSLNQLKMSAAEMLCFTRYLGLFVGDLVPENNSIWRLYISLRKIVDIITSPSLHRDTYIFLNTMITDFLNDYIELLKEKLKPKFHYLLHYARILKMSGPLVLFWSMRFESKHRESKMSANVSCSRKNILETLTIKHQLKLCYSLLSDDLFKDEIKVKSLVAVKSHVCKDISALGIYCDVFEAKEIEIRGLVYKIGTTVITGYDDINPQFGDIKKMFLANDKVIFLFHQLTTLDFYEHFFAYEVIEGNKQYYKLSTSISNVVPCLKIRKNQTLFVCLRHS